jgi:ABC-2 type transport system permease protein
MRMIANIFWLGTKELRSFLHDYVLLGLVIYAFSFAIIAQAQSSSQEVHNASVGIVDEDHSQLSRRIGQAFLPPFFKRPQPIAERDIMPLMNAGQYTFVVDIPPNFERDVLAGGQPALQLNVDATAMVQAGLGASYAQQIMTAEIAEFLSHTEGVRPSPVDLLVRIEFNPNLTTAWFTSVMGIINSVTMLAIILAGAAIIREREHGTMDHLLVMPVTPFEIAMSKVWANALVILVAVGLSLYVVVRGLLGIPIAGSIPLFMLGVAVYLFFATAVGIFLGTIARSMPQLGLLYILVYSPMMMLSGSNTPLESMPPWLATIMEASPSTHFVSFAQAILYRGAGFATVWRQFVLVALIGGLFFGAALLRFRKVASTATCSCPSVLPPEAQDKAESSPKSAAVRFGQGILL